MALSGNITGPLSADYSCVNEILFLKFSGFESEPPLSLIEKCKKYR